MPLDKRVWYNSIERDAFVETHCDRCFQPDQAIKRITGDGPGCPHLARAEQNKMPTPWTRRRNPVMGDTYKCDEFTPKPPTTRRGRTVDDATPAMLEAYAADRHLVPVDGWPDWAALQRKPKEGEHQ